MYISVGRRLNIKGKQVSELYDSENGYEERYINESVMRWGGWETEDHGGDGGAQRALWWDDIWAKTKDKNETAMWRPWGRSFQAEGTVTEELEWAEDDALEE